MNTNLPPTFINPALVPEISFNWSWALLLQHSTTPYLRVNGDTWRKARPLPNFAIMKPRSAVVVAAAWNHINYTANFPWEFEDAVAGGIVFG